MTVYVVGGGPAGMMAAIAAAKNNNKVVLVEKNEKLGKKLFLTGKGRCNLTNACPVEELFDNIVTNPKFLYSAFYDFDNNATVSFFNDMGLVTKVERGERVFPADDKASSVTAALKKCLSSLSVKILLNTTVTAIETGGEGGLISGVILKDAAGEKKYRADAVILATGGKSYPLTGSDGRMTEYLKTFGIKVNESRPSLVPFVCNDRLITDMQGLSLKNVSVSVRGEKKEIFSGFGEMLFTHFGLSGPLILSASAYVNDSDYKAGITVNIDLKPALSEEELDRRILRDFEENSNRNFSNSLGKLLPSKLISAVIKKSGIDPSKKVNIISREERRRLCRTLKDFEIKVCGCRGFDEAIITRGGIAVSAINPSTMECKSIKGLYFAGEMIDVDALTGGFNLQIAWSTGHLAGSSCM